MVMKFIDQPFSPEGNLHWHKLLGFVGFLTHCYVSQIVGLCQSFESGVCQFYAGAFWGSFYSELKILNTSFYGL